ncbi:putative ABC-type spermidine/putrescine transport protein [Burkholderia pseudomallei]|nr:putative ABC-type spermidine/putrescine transport protein [Burkholderia pseudomallei]
MQTVDACAVSGAVQNEWSYPVERRVDVAMPLAAMTDELVRIRDLDRTLSQGSSLVVALKACVADAVHRAFVDGDEASLTDVHRALYTLYELHVAAPASGVVTNQFSPLLTDLRGILERRWMESECRHLRVLPTMVASGELVTAIKAVVTAHPASHHRLFDWIERTATRAQLEGFFRSDTALNVRFFDLIVMAMIGSMPEVRKELASNFWDEAGRGDPQRTHVRLFRRLLDELGIGQAEDDFASELTWQGLRGYNLFMCCALNRQHYFKLLGVMAATELLDPPQYRKLIAGCRRLGIGPASTAYYDEHASIDEVHGEGWLEHVIRPVVEREPGAMREVLLGCMLRLASCHDYYDALHQRLSMTAGTAGADEVGTDHATTKTRRGALEDARKDAG